MARIIGLEMQVFPCSLCGLCCQRVGLSDVTQDLDRGDGTCKHFDEYNKNCTIYDTRPDMCRVDLQYRVNYSKKHTWDEFVALNLEVCELLQMQTLSVPDQK